MYQLIEIPHKQYQKPIYVNLIPHNPTSYFPYFSNITRVNLVTGPSKYIKIK